MQATLQVRRFPTRTAAIGLAFASALVGGGALGYALKPPSIVSGATRVVQVTGDPAFGKDDCIRVDRHKAC
jgi:hypothetical protein